MLADASRTKMTFSGPLGFALASGSFAASHEELESSADTAHTVLTHLDIVIHILNF
jgi:hypothetical protein